MISFAKGIAIEIVWKRICMVQPQAGNPLKHKEKFSLENFSAIESAIPDANK